MLYLILAILSSALVSIIMRFSKEKTETSAGLFISNYLVCSILSLTFIKGFNPFVKSDGLNFSIIFGFISGIFFLGSFVLLEQNIRKNGVVLSSIFMKLGIIVPVLMAIFIFREKVIISHIIGIVLAIIAIILINYEKNKEKKKGLKIFLILLLVVSGLTDSTANIYDKLGVSSLSSNYLFFIFITAFFLSILLCIIKKEKPGKWDLLFGVLVGIPNYFSSKFLLKSLSTMNAVVVYPTYSIATIVLIGLVGVLFFKEKLEKLKIIGFILVLISLVLLNI